MDYERFYDKKGDGAYLLHFPNSKGLGSNEIESIFSDFGKVLSVDVRGQTHGLCFVRYQRLDDVKRCIDGLQNHEFIKILPHKSKMYNNQNTQKKKYYKHDQDTSNGSSPVPYSKNQFQNRNKDNIRSKRYSRQLGDNQSDCSEPQSLFRKDESPFNDDTVENGNGSDISLVTPRRSINQFLKLKMLQRAASSTSVSSGTVEEGTKTVEGTIDQNEIPPLICKDQKLTGCNRRFSTLTSIIVPAQEVIVANIHPNLGIHYILHLFEKHNPLSVSHMMTTSKTGIRYCHVYFETAADATATEKEFDMHVLHGSNLIVLRSQTLKEEALLL